MHNGTHAPHTLAHTHMSLAFRGFYAIANVCIGKCHGLSQELERFIWDTDTHIGQIIDVSCAALPQTPSPSLLSTHPLNKWPLAAGATAFDFYHS